MKQYNYKKLSYKQIEKVITGDTEAMTELVELYMPYIKKLSDGNQDTEDKIVARLMNTVLRFKLDYKAKQGQS